MSTQSRTKPSTLLFALITAVSLATTAPIAAAVEEQMKETDGHAHDRDHHKDDRASKNTASSKKPDDAGMSGRAGAKSDDIEHQAEETDGHDHEAHKKEHKLDSKK